MTYRTTGSDLTYKYRVRVLTPRNEKFDEYIIAATKERAKQALLDKYGKDHKALVLDQEPGNVYK
tara:strand:- start:5754 stop:5948 length:195 start_codon:yes stop_codon:yes gene_type:complete